MKSHGESCDARKVLEILAIAMLAISFGGTLTAPRLRAEALPRQSAGDVPWQLAASGKRAFDVTSVKANKSGDPANSTFPLGPGDGYTPNGGLFAASNPPLIVYLTFAYKLRQADLLNVP